MYHDHLESWVELVLFDGDGSAPDMSEWADLFGGLPLPETAAFYGLCRFCEAHSATVDSVLPWLAAEIGRSDGYATMLRFIQAWSGMRLYVPKSHARFVERVGCNLCASTHTRLLREVGHGAQIEVPSAWGVFLSLRRAAIAIAMRTKLPHEEISRRFGVTMRSLR